MSSQPQEKHSKFFDLSAEVLDEIIGHLDNLHSFRLCMLSRRVHQYLLPSYLRKCGITHSEALDALTLNADKATENAFRLARTSPLISKVRHLQCKFHFPESQLLWEFRSIYGVLAKLENVERVTLDFENLHCIGLNARPYIKQTDEWQDAFVTILRKIMEASPSTLEIVGRVHALWFIPLTFNRVLHPDEQTLPFGLLHSLKNRFTPKWIMRRRLDKDWPPPCESAVFQRVFRDTSLSSITSLSLRSSDISSHEWALIGPYVSFPNLAELSLDLEPLGSFEAISGRDGAAISGGMHSRVRLVRDEKMALKVTKSDCTRFC
ncbi:hypothetical protein ONZ45_g9624 [Pleurotus djamor]|nr:hypothetical protein ONZ45_g9624 [Pleurotus djamor]